MAWKYSAKCATLDRLWYSGNMITIIPIEPVSDAHGALIVEAFNMFFIDGGGWPDSDGDGVGYGYGNGNGCGNAGGGKCPEEWRVQ